MIDLCVCLSGPFLDVMLPFFIASLREHNDLGPVHLHLVLRDVSAAVRDWVSHIPGAVTVYSLPTQFQRRTQEQRTPFDHTVADCAGACKWMVENCGSAPIVFISHFDIVFKRALLDYFIGLFGDSGIGQAGSHGSGLVGYRREAVRQCDVVGFDAMSGFCLVRDQYSNWKLRHRSDPRCINTDLPLHAFDVGELIEIAMGSRGWGIASEPDAWLNDWRVHLGTGSGHAGDLDQKRAQAMTILDEMGLKPI